MTTAPLLGLREPTTIERGALLVDTPASPAAGANYTRQVGDLRAPFVRVVSVLATLTTDANAANRLFSLDYLYRGTATAIRNAPTLVITANQSATVFQWDQDHTLSEWNTNTPVFTPLLDVLLTPGWAVQLTLDSKQVGDTITAITICYELFYADSPSDLPD